MSNSEKCGRCASAEAKVALIASIVSKAGGVDVRTIGHSHSVAWDAIRRIRDALASTQAAPTPDQFKSIVEWVLTGDNYARDCQECAIWVEVKRRYDAALSSTQADGKRGGE